VEILLAAEAGLAPSHPCFWAQLPGAVRYAANRNLQEACAWWAYNSLKESTWASDIYR
jgi:hypothetical protein